MKAEFRFPLSGWHFASSDTTGADMLYGGLSVVERIFPDSEADDAHATLEFLKSADVDSAQLHRIQHVGTDGKFYFYVFAERSQFLGANIPSVSIEQKRSGRMNLWKVVKSWLARA